MGLYAIIPKELGGDKRAQMAAQMEVAMRRVSCELIMEGEKKLPLVIDEKGATDGNDDDDDEENMIEEITETTEKNNDNNNNNNNNNDNNQTIELVLNEPPTRPARVSIEPSRSII
eukprot:jgi/Psemu1/24268/gm1.24268_g